MYLVLYYCIDKIVLLFYTNTLLNFSCPILPAAYSNVENSEGDGNARPPDLPLQKPVCRSGSNT